MCSDYAVHNADLDTDHSLVGSLIRLRHHNKQKGHPRIDISRISQLELHKHFAEAMDLILRNCPSDNAKAHWAFIGDPIYQTASDIFGKRGKMLTGSSQVLRR
jgi:hypothetical protein